jgi:L-fucose mutarotase
MVRSTLIHPEILSALSYCGHGSRILIADGNYPLAEKTGNAKKVYLGLRRGLPGVLDVLQEIHTTVNIEGAMVMMPEEGPEPEIFEAFRSELDGIELKKLGRFDFYATCMEEDALVLAISTGEQRPFANIVLTIGCA